MISQVAAIMLAKGLSLKNFFELYNKKCEKDLSRGRDSIWDITFESFEGDEFMLLDYLSYLILDYMPRALIDDLDLTSQYYKNCPYGKPQYKITNLHSLC